ncbi:MAG TPA: condensation domain-containing protein, partial [Pyrinomonadaceae bacterium]|nr:condensation domain-containing protein [Pyrinomonadaceae bacterium]
MSEEVFVFPQSYAQQRLWFMDQLAPGSLSYSMPLAFHIQGQLDLAALQYSFNSIISRHETLRTTFTILDERPVQVVSPEVKFSLEVTDLRDVAEGERAATARLMLEEAAREGFDLRRGPLVRARVWRVGEEEHMLLLAMHHIISDGWSMGVIMKELGEHYGAYVERREAQVRELEVQYADYTEWQREWLDGAVMEEQLEYWRQQLGRELPVMQLPADHPRPATQTFNGAYHSFWVSPELTKSLNALSQQTGGTLFMTLLAAFKTLLRYYTGQEDIVVGFPVANRNRSETADLIGCFANMLALRTDLSGDLSFIELIGRVREVTINAYAHQDLPFEKLVEELHPERIAGSNPLIQVVCVLLNTALEMIELSGLKFTSINLDLCTVKFDLELHLIETADGLICTIAYNTDLFEPATILRMANHFQYILEEIVRVPEQPLSHFSLLSASQRRSLRALGSGPARPLSPALPLHHLFHRQALLHPDLPALCSPSGSLSFAQLDARSTQLALFLLSRFSAPGVSTSTSARAYGSGRTPAPRLALCLAPGFDLVVALLAALKAGLPFLLLSPSARPARLAALLREAEADALLTLPPTNARLREALPSSLRVWSLDLLADELDALRGSEPPPVPASLHSPAYVRVVAGEDGAPTVVEISHAVALNRVQWLQQEFGLAEGEAVLCHAATTQPVEAVWQTLWPLLSGGRVALAGGDSPEEVVRVIGRERVAVAHG